MKEWQTLISDRQNPSGKCIILNQDCGSFLAFGLIVIKYKLKILSEMLKMFY